MPRKLKVYQTSIGFYDHAIAAPSMKAALEAWGANSNLFHQGVAGGADDPAVVAATLAKPGVVMKRPIGSTGAFGEHSELPDLTGGPARRGPKPSGRNVKKRASKVDDASQQKAAVQYEKEQRRRKAAREREEAAQARLHEQRQRAVARAHSALEVAEREHDKNVASLMAERDAIDGRLKFEETRWDGQRRKLATALHRMKNHS